MTRKAFKIEEVVPGSHLFYEYEELTPKGERLVVEMLRFDNPGGKNSIPVLWRKHGYTSTVLDDWWSVNTYAYDNEGNCYGRYNPTVKREESRDRLRLEATGNRRKPRETSARDRTSGVRRGLDKRTTAPLRRGIKGKES